MLLEEGLKPQELFRRIADWLYAEAEARKISLRIYTQLIEERSSEYYTFIHIPVHVFGDRDAYDKAKTLGRLERLWNDREPRPEKLLFLRPAPAPRDGS
jgi:hypothetical protein